MPNVPRNNIALLDVDSVNEQGIIILTSDGKQYKATCSSYRKAHFTNPGSPLPLEPSLKKGDRLRIMYQNPTNVFLPLIVQRTINGKLDDVKFRLVFNVD
jgi:hypothetical protein